MTKRMNTRTYITLFVSGLLVIGASILLLVWMRAPSPQSDQPEFAQTLKAPSAETLISYGSAGATQRIEEVGEVTHIAVTWATWCRLCTDVLRDLERVHNERDGALPVLAVNRAEPDQIARPYVMREFATSPLLFVADTDDRYFKEAEGYAMPELLIVSPDGDILYRHRGPITYDELNAQLGILSL